MNKDFFKHNKEMIIKTSILLLCLVLTLPIIISDLMMIGKVHNGFTKFFMNPIYGMIANIIICFVIGYDYFVKTYYEWFKWKTIGMNTLVSITVSISFIWSIYQFGDNIYHLGFKETIDFNHQDEGSFAYFFEVGCSLVTILKIGGYIDYFLKRKLKKDSNTIKQLISLEANLYNLKTKEMQLTKVNQVNIGDYIFVKKNEKVPLDGILYSSSCTVEESFITGEVSFIAKTKGQRVFAGSINQGDSFILMIDKKHSDNLINQIVKRLNTIQSKKMRLQRVVDTIAKWFTPTILSLGVLCFIIMLFFGYDIQNGLGLQNFSLIPHFQKWDSYNIATNNSEVIEQNLKCSFYFMIATIVVSCPCALGIAAPLGMIIGTSKASQNGVVFNNQDAFEVVKKIDVIALDKTGTLTKGKLSVSEVIGSHKYLNLVYGIETEQNHPIAKAVCEYLALNKIKPSKVKSIKQLSNSTFEAVHNKDKLIITSTNSKQYQKAKKDIKLEKQYLESISKTNIKTSFVVLVNNKVVNYFILKDELRDECKQFIELMKKLKITPIVITGDNEENSMFLKEELGIQDIYANVDPFQKEQIIQNLQEQGKFVCYVGDGLNDLMALKASDLSINISTNISQTDSVSDITLLDNNLINIYKAIKLAKFTRSIIKSNLTWSFSYNTLVIPIAFLGIIPTLFSMIAMLFSDIIVSTNSIVCSYINPFKELKHLDK